MPAFLRVNGSTDLFRAYHAMMDVKLQHFRMPAVQGKIPNL